MADGSWSCSFLSEPPPVYLWSHAHPPYLQISIFFCCFTVTLDLQLAIILDSMKNTNQTTRVVMAPGFHWVLEED